MTERICSSQGCERKHLARGLCSYHYYLIYNKQMVPASCTVCGKSMMRQVDSKRASCSAECFWWLQPNAPRACPVPDLHPSRSTRIPGDHPSRVYQRPISGATRVFIPDCSVCGTTFVTIYTRLTCGTVCALLKRRADRRDDDHRRRARKRNAYVADVYRLKVFSRDKWTCHLCHKKVNRNVVAPHPRSPTLDHIIPLAAGGTHEPANCATACFRCNCVKRELGGNEQLLLIG